MGREDRKKLKEFNKGTPIAKDEPNTVRHVSLSANHLALGWQNGDIDVFSPKITGNSKRHEQLSTEKVPIEIYLRDGKFSFTIREVAFRNIRVCLASSANLIAVASTESTHVYDKNTGKLVFESRSH